jgi:acyl-CoA hydrolase
MKSLATPADAVALLHETLGKRWYLAAPLGLGKPNHLLNAIYAAAKSDPTIDLKIMTALSLARPQPKADLERRFLAPFVSRWWGDDYPDLEYVRDVRQGKVPANIEIREFYLQSGSMLGAPTAQCNYVSVNYTHVARDVAAAGANVAVQLIARRDTPQGPRYSLSCNTDTTLDLRDRLAAEGRRLVLIGVVHPELPFVGNDAEIDGNLFDAILESPPHRLFALPRQPVEDAEYVLGLHASTLVKDGGTLQIGIGALSDAVVYALKLREEDNASYRALTEALQDPAERLIAAKIGGYERFAVGLYGASEMVMDGFMELRRAGILRRRVYESTALQELLNRGAVSTTLRGEDLDLLIEAGVYPRPLTQNAIGHLVTLGLLPVGTALLSRERALAAGTELDTLLTEPATRAWLREYIDGRELRGGRYLHGAFYLGSAALYDWLRQLHGEDFDGLSMTRVSHINELYGGQESLQRAQRHEARFFNTCMMQTLLGAAVSDALDSGQVVSGVGGQYNFVAMAHALPTGRSVLMLRASRESGGEVRSNIVWNYGHTTIPRHLRDIVVTEYGIADLRGQSDAECIRRLLAISDARFQDELLARAKTAGKVPPDTIIADRHRRNTPEHLAEALRDAKRKQLFPLFPFGADFDAIEQRIVAALRWLKANTAHAPDRLRALLAALAIAPGEPERAPLERLQLHAPKTLNERLHARLVTMALRRTA